MTTCLGQCLGPTLHYFVTHFCGCRSYLNIILFKTSLEFAVSVMRTKRGCLHTNGYLNCTRNHLRLDLLLILAHARLPNYQNC